MLRYSRARRAAAGRAARCRGSRPRPCHRRAAGPGRRGRTRRGPPGPRRASATPRRSWRCARRSPPAWRWPSRPAAGAGRRAAGCCRLRGGSRRIARGGDHGLQPVLVDLDQQVAAMSRLGPQRGGIEGDMVERHDRGRAAEGEVFRVGKGARDAARCAPRGRAGSGACAGGRCRTAPARRRAPAPAAPGSKGPLTRPRAPRPPARARRRVRLR